MCLLMEIIGDLPSKKAFSQRLRFKIEQESQPNIMLLCLQESQEATLRVQCEPLVTLFPAKFSKLRVICMLIAHPVYFISHKRKAWSHMDEKQKRAKFKISWYFCNNQVLLVFTSALVLFPFVWFSFLTGIGFCLVEFFSFLLLIIICQFPQRQEKASWL